MRRKRAQPAPVLRILIINGEDARISCDGKVDCHVRVVFDGLYDYKEVLFKKDKWSGDWKDTTKGGSEDA